jgi:hypothetical protein
VFACNGNNPRSNVNTNIGFRSALASQLEADTLKGVGQHEVKGVHLPTSEKTGAKD